MKSIWTAGIVMCAIACLAVAQGRDDDIRLLQELKKAVEGGSESERIKALEELGSNPSWARSAIPLIVPSLSETSEAVRSAAIWAIQAFGSDGTPAVAAVVRSIDTDDPSVQFDLIFLLHDIAGDIPRARTAFVNLLSHRESSVRATAALAVSGDWEDDSEVSSKLAWMVANDQLSVAEPAAQSMRLLLTKDERIVATLTKGLSSQEAARTELCAWALADLGALARPAVTGLRELGASTNISCRAAGQYALWSIGFPEFDVVKTLVECMRQRQSLERCLHALCQMGDAGVGALSVVESLAGEDDSYIRSNAVLCVARIAPDGSSKGLALVGAAVKDPDGSVRVAACRGLREFRRQHLAAVGILRKSLGDSDGFVVDAALESLGELGGLAESAVLDVAGLLADSTVTSSAIQTLSKIGTASAAECLVTALDENSAYVLEIIPAIGLIGSAAIGAAETLKSIKDDDSELDIIRVAAELALTRIRGK